MVHCNRSCTCCSATLVRMTVGQRQAVDQLHSLCVWVTTEQPRARSPRPLVSRRCDEWLSVIIVIGTMNIWSSFTVTLASCSGGSAGADYKNKETLSVCWAAAARVYRALLLVSYGATEISLNLVSLLNSNHIPFPHQRNHLSLLRAKEQQSTQTSTSIIKIHL